MKSPPIAGKFVLMFSTVKNIFQKKGAEDN